MTEPSQCRGVRPLILTRGDGSPLRCHPPNTCARSPCWISLDLHFRRNSSHTSNHVATSCVAHKRTGVIHLGVMTLPVSSCGETTGHKMYWIGLIVQFSQWLPGLKKLYSFNCTEIQTQCRLFGHISVHLKGTASCLNEAHQWSKVK